MQAAHVAYRAQLEADRAEALAEDNDAEGRLRRRYGSVTRDQWWWA